MSLASRESEVSPRQWAEWNHEKEMYGMQSSHMIRAKELDVELERLQSKWQSWLKLPLKLVLLPVLVLVGLSFIVYPLVKKDVPESLINLLK